MLALSALAPLAHKNCDGALDADPVMLLYIARLWQWECGHAKEESRVWGGGRFGHLIPTQWRSSLRAAGNSRAPIGSSSPTTQAPPMGRAEMWGNDRRGPLSEPGGTNKLKSVGREREEVTHTRQAIVFQM